MTEVTKANRWRSVALVVASAVLVAGTGSAWGADPEQRKQRVEGQLQDARQDLQESTGRLKDATAAYRDAQGRLVGAREALATAQTNLAQARADLATAQNNVAAAEQRDAQAAQRLEQAEQQVALQERRIAALAAEIKRKRDQMGRVAARAYQQGSLPDVVNLMTILESDNIDEFTSRVTLVQSAINAEGVVVDGLEADRRRLAREKIRLEALRDVAEQRREEAANALAETRELKAAAKAAEQRATALAAQATTAEQKVEQLVAQQGSAMAAAEAAKEQDEREYRELQAERRRIEAEIKAEIARQRAAERAKSKASTSKTTSPTRSRTTSRSSTRDGYLSRPVSGRITSSYGMRVHPITGVYKLHDGTDFAASCGTPIRAAASGRVQWARYRGGYGNQVLVDHGEVKGVRLMTSYSHLSRFSSYAGERVTRGEVIGYVGSTGYSTGCHLHFMVYEDGNTVNPMRWL